MSLNKQDSEYTSGPKYAKILYFTQRSEYVRICLDRVLNIPWVLNMHKLHRVLPLDETHLDVVRGLI